MLWQDLIIERGQTWKEEIWIALHQSDIILFLMSADSIHSDFIWDVELKKTFERHERKEVVFIPIYLRNCNWQEIAPLKEFQAIPRDNKPMISRILWDSIDTPFAEVAKEVIQKVKQKWQEINNAIIEQTFSASILVAKEGKGGSAAPSPAQEAVDFKPLNIFISYSKHDRKNYLEPMLHYLFPLVRGGWLANWDDSKILPGEEWDDTIKQEIERADIILLLVSTKSLNTDYIWNVEIEAAMRRHEARTAWVVPVILSKCRWQQKDPSNEYIFPPAMLNALPAKGKPVSTWKRREDAWDEVAEGLMRICKARKG